MQNGTQQTRTQKRKSNRDEFFILFKTEAAAHERMVMRNRAYRAAGNRKDIACKLEHPDGWVVCDLRTAIETEMPYAWAA